MHKRQTEDNLKGWLLNVPAPLSHVGFHGPKSPEDLPIQVEDDVGLMRLQHGGQHVQDRAPFPPA